jgi:hypothetical protein
MGIEERKQRMEALRCLIEKEKSVSIATLKKQLTGKWYLTERKADEYIRCLGQFPHIHPADGCLTYKK